MKLFFWFKQKTAYEMRISDWSSDVCSSDLKAKADFEEGGSNTLFLALGMLRWAAPGDAKRSYRAPLILLPVKLERRSAASKPFLTKQNGRTSRRERVGP